MFSIILQTVRGMLDSVICTTHLSGNFDSEFNKKELRKCFAFVQYSM